MTTLPPIQPRPILCKPSSNNVQTSSSFFLLHSANQPSNLTNTNFYSVSNDLTNTNSSSQSSLPSTPLSSYEEFIKRLREFHRCRQYVLFRRIRVIDKYYVFCYLNF